MKVLPNLTGLRFILAFLVVIFHIPHFCENRGFPFFNSLAIFNKGEEAVYMFFSLSGFLIIRQLYTEKSITNTINLRTFFLKRVLRIFPLYYLVLSFGLLYYRLILPYFGFSFQNNYDLLYGIFLSYTFFSNIFVLYQPGGIIEILWSIGIEEQFYVLIAPLILLLPFRYITQFLIAFTLIYFLLYFSTSMSFLKSTNMLFFYFSFSGICSILTLNQNVKLHNFRYIVFGIFILYFTTSIFSNYLTILWYHLFSMLLFGLVISSFAEKPIKILQGRIINYLGRISYGVYMYHAILMQFVGFLFLKSNFYKTIPSLFSIVIFNVLVLVLTIITAHISYKYFESYFLNLKKKWVY